MLRFEEYRIFVECENDNYVANNFIRPAIARLCSSQNVPTPRVRHFSGRTNILKLYVDGKVRNSILIVDYDVETNWPPDHRHILDKSRPLSQGSPLGDVLHYVDNEKGCLILIIKRYLEDWIVRSCHINCDPHEIKAKNKFRKLCNENECVRTILTKLSDNVAKIYLELIKKI